MSAKHLAIIMIIMFSYSNIFSQQLTYKNHEIDTIIIRSIVGINHPIRGKYQSCIDQLCISYNNQINSYEINSYKKIKHLRKKSKVEKIKELKKYQSINVPNEKIQFLINSLDTGYSEIEAKNIGIYETNIDSFIDQFCISIRYKLSQEEMEKSKNLDFFNGFLLEKFNKEKLNEYSINTGSYDLFNIEIITLKQNFIITGLGKNLLRQPWNIYLPVDDTTYISSTQFINVLNLNINNALLQILPKDFMNINSLKIDQLIREYLRSNVSNQGIEK